MSKNKYVYYAVISKNGGKSAVYTEPIKTFNEAYQKLLEMMKSYNIIGNNIDFCGVIKVGKDCTKPLSRIIPLELFNLNIEE